MKNCKILQSGKPLDRGLPHFSVTKLMAIFNLGVQTCTPKPPCESIHFKNLTVFKVNGF